MENPLEELPHVLPLLLSTDLGAVNLAVGKYFTKDAEFHHPLFRVVGRDEIRILYRMWSRSNWSFSAIHISEVYQGTIHGTLRIALDLTYTPRPILFFASPVYPRIITLIHLEKSSDNTDRSKARYLIKKQEDFLNTDVLFGLMVPPHFGNVGQTLGIAILRLSGLFCIFVLDILSSILNFIFVGLLNIKPAPTHPKLVIEKPDQH